MNGRYYTPTSIVLVGLLSFSSFASADSGLREARDQAAHFSAGAASAYFLNRVFELPDWMVLNAVMGGAYIREAAQSGFPRHNTLPHQTCGRGCRLDMSFYALGAATVTDLPAGPRLELRDDGVRVMWVKEF
ncbi:MAG: hypothetical protein GWN84_09925 [Gammaproteobacteria bacterium]|nr:hypothetical protein [Gammaproteobacteria bacterium]NIR83181.1 hypothetical protein [Gammaproteobacteria bacterium]NIR90989.1 hypothetical protein [Gammaproteobacteria bacterium]NIU04346.1 hypothetical protein [Gammaproteobacteria bacterium]NIV52569.1 hypothetical protein [Gammaproteobacteria bacterium]